MDVMPGTKVFRSTILHYENDLAVQLEDRHVCARSVPDYLKHRADGPKANDAITIKLDPPMGARHSEAWKTAFPLPTECPLA